jgi:hypothetical protein
VGRKKDVRCELGEAKKSTKKKRADTEHTNVCSRKERVKQQDEIGNNICTECFNSKLMNKPESDRGLPVWIDDNQDMHYELPLELTVLTEGEKLLIQQVSAYIPLHH